MFSFLKKKPSSVLGIDIGLTSIHMLELSNTRGQYCVEGFGSVQLPTNSNDTAALVECIKEMIPRAQFSSNTAVIALPDSNVISKIIQISAYVPEQDIEAWVFMDAEKYIPYSMNEMNVDFNILGPSAMNGDQLDVLVVISRAESVQRRVEMVRQMGLDVQAVEVESYAIERAARLCTEKLFMPQQEEHMAWFDINLSCLRSFVFKGNQIIFSREETQEITDDLELFRKQLLQKINRHLHFFESPPRAVSIQRIALAGNSDKVNELDCFLQSSLGIPTYIANPFINMTFATDELRNKIDKKTSELIVACGLALRR